MSGARCLDRPHTKHDVERARFGRTENPLGKEGSVRRILCRIFEEAAPSRRPILAIAVVLSLGCGCGSAEIEAKQPESPTAGEEPGPVEVALFPPSSSRSEHLYLELREKARKTSAEPVVAVDEQLRAAESEFPLEFRFSYERAKLAVFGRHDHHEAFGRLRRAAEKAIKTGRSEWMLAMLRSDGVQNGPFWKLARGHPEWHQILAALENGNTETLWNEHHDETEIAVREAPEPPSEAQALDGSLTHPLERLRHVRARLGLGESAAVEDGIGVDRP